MGGFFGGGGGASVDLASPPAIGNTTPNTGRFTTLTADTSLTITQPSNYTGGLIFTNAAIQQGSGDLLFVARNNKVAFLNGNILAWLVRPDGQLGFDDNTNVGQGTADTVLRRDAAGVLAQRRTTNAQTFRLYNTYTDASNYERGFFRWASNVLEIGHEVAGTGVNRNVRIITRAQGGHVALGSSSSIGFGINGDNSPSVVVNSVERLGVGASGIVLCNDANTRIAFSGDAAYLNDLFILRDGAANALGQRNGSSGQSFRLYRTWTNSTNYERLNIISTRTTRFAIAVENAGTGAARSLEISFYTSASDPTSTDITDGCFSVWKNSGTGTIKLWANDGGTMKSVALA